MAMIETAIKSKQRVKRISNIKKAITYIILSIVGISMIVPFLWMVSTSLKEPGEVFTYPPKWIPNPIIWENYPKAWNAVPFTRGYINSIFVAVTVTFGQVLTSSLAAYAFSRLSFPLRDKLFLGYLGTMMIPGAVTMIPVFILLRKLEWINTYKALIIPCMFSAYGTFMLRQFFMGLPTDLEDAAKIDGCSLFGIYWKIILPLSKPALATLTIFTFMGSWMNFMWPLIVTNDMELKTLPVMLASFQGLYTTDWTLLMAGSIIVLAPIIVVFIIGQRYFVEGIRLGAVKG